MINIPQGFHIGSTEPVDFRLILSTDEMLTINDDAMPDVYFTVCKEDGNVYIYNKTNSFDEITGRFRIINQSDSNYPILVSRLQNDSNTLLILNGGTADKEFK